MSVKLNKIQQDILLDLPIRYHYKNKIKHICEKHNLRVQSFLEYVLGSYFGEFPRSSFSLEHHLKEIF